MTTYDISVPRRRRTRLGHLSAALVLLVLAAVLLPAAGASATVFPVVNLADAGPGSLRDAIMAANGNNGPDSITIGLTGTIDLSTELAATNGDLEISGPGAGALTIERAPASATAFRVISSGTEALSLSGVTIAGGRAEKGGGILSLGPLSLTGVDVTGNTAAASGGEDPSALGAGIYVEGPLTMRETTVSGNFAAASQGTSSSGALAGGVLASGGSVIDRSTISANKAEASAPNGRVSAIGGGVVLSGSSRIDRSTISGNSATATGGTMQPVGGGGIFAEETLTVTGSTVTGNSAAGNAPLGMHAVSGANLEVPATTVLRDTIVSNPGGTTSCTVQVVSGGFNIDDGTSCGLAQPTDRSSTNPGLAPALANNGGPTPTLALLPGSPAIDAGNAFGLGTDQRGLPRPSDFQAIPNATGGDGSDIGAFEAPAPPFVSTPPPAPAPSPDTTAPQTRIAHGPAHVTGQALAVFRFASSEAGSRFQCKLDKATFRACASPFKRKVSAGAKHVLLVRAIDRAGNVDGTPARYAWTVTAAHGAGR
jgi:hypothetical protein